MSILQALFITEEKSDIMEHLCQKNSVMHEYEIVLRVPLMRVEEKGNHRSQSMQEILKNS